MFWCFRHRLVLWILIPGSSELKLFREFWEVDT